VATNVEKLEGNLQPVVTENEPDDE
jgi:hypothetical protein